GANDATWQDRAHSFAVSALMMRCILVDRARARTSDKRGGAPVKVDLNESINALSYRSESLVALDEGLDALAKYARKAHVVEMNEVLRRAERRGYGHRAEDSPRRVMGTGTWRVPGRCAR